VVSGPLPGGRVKLCDFGLSRHLCNNTEVIFYTSFLFYLCTIVIIVCVIILSWCIDCDFCIFSL